MADVASFDADRNVLVAGGQRLVFHCHHYNVLLQQTVQDALGASAVELQRAAAAEASRRMLEGVLEAERVTGLGPRLARAAEVFGSLGFGSASVEGLGPLGGEVRLVTSHYATGWRSKLGASSAPVCHFAAGYFRGALAVAAGLAPERVTSHETSCAARDGDGCVIVVEVR